MALKTDGFLACGCREGHLRSAEHTDGIKYVGSDLAGNVYVGEWRAAQGHHRSGLFVLDPQGSASLVAHGKT